jgi:hypothetical protein
MHLNVLVHQHVEGLQLFRAEPALIEQDGPERPGLVEGPGLHGGDKDVAADEVHLQGQETE